MNKAEDTMTTKEIAEYLNCNVRTLVRNAKKMFT